MHMSCTGFSCTRGEGCEKAGDAKPLNRADLHLISPANLHMYRLRLLSLSLLLFAACGDDPVADSSDDTDVGSDAIGAGPDAAPDVGLLDDALVEPDGETAAAIAGRCDYANPFGGSPECKQYDGEGWTVDDAIADCEGLPAQSGTVFTEALRCELESELGLCLLDEGEPFASTLTIGGNNPSQCAISVVGCETFGSGRFEPSPLCSDTDPVVEPPTPTATGFVQPYLDCRPPLPGEPAGESDGEVCTQVLISACTEPGRRFEDYASCEDVLTQRPYYGYGTPVEENPDDPRLQDDEYMGELEWLTDQVEACACVCCHAEDIAPSGPSGWNIDAGALWIDSVPDAGLAMLAGLVDSDAFGAYPPEENNGFDRSITGLPTTDVDRMQTFLVAEYLRRGNEETDADGIAPFGGPLYQQSLYEPEACVNGDGFDAEGRIQWPAGAARYLYVMAEGSANPGVPPNRDLPPGTLWRVDVPNDRLPMGPGVAYGEVPDGAFQRFPFEMPPEALQPGENYYIYALADVGLPILRCVSTYLAD